MSILLNQMNLVHKLELPIDMIRVIKSYAFKERTAYKAEIIKNKIIHCINHTYYSGANYLRSEENGEPSFTEEDGFLFWIMDDEKCPQFQSVFCKSCGNYKTFHEHMGVKSCCVCL